MFIKFNTHHNNVDPVSKSSALKNMQAVLTYDSSSSSSESADENNNVKDEIKVGKGDVDKAEAEMQSNTNESVWLKGDGTGSRLKRNATSILPAPSLSLLTKKQRSSTPLMPEPSTHHLSLSKPETFIAHIHIPVCDKRVEHELLRKANAITRLRFVNRIPKPILTPISLTDLHVSVARATPVMSVDVGRLVNELRRRIAKVDAGFFALRPHQVEAFKSQKGEQNGTGRVFVAMRATGTVLFNLIDAINETFVSCGLPPHFDEPKPHMSFAWSDVDETLNIINSPVSEGSTLAVKSLYNADKHGCQDVEIKVHYVVCNISKSSYTFNLNGTKTTRIK